MAGLALAILQNKREKHTSRQNNLKLDTKSKSASIKEENTINHTKEVNVHKDSIPYTNNARTPELMPNTNLLMPAIEQVSSSYTMGSSIHRKPENGSVSESTLQNGEADRNEENNKPKANKKKKKRRKLKAEQKNKIKKLDNLY